MDFHDAFSHALSLSRPATQDWFAETVKAVLMIAFYFP
jgi:hypothetical protein